MDRSEESLILHLRRSAAGGIMLLAAFGLAGCNTLAAAFLKPDIDTAAATLPAGDYKLDPKHASLFFRINHLGYSTYIGRFERFDASLTGDPAHPETAEVTAIVDMSSLNVADPELAEQLMGSEWFDTARYPQAHFESYGLRLTSETQAEIDGDLTLKGRTQPVIIRAKLNGSAYDPLRSADIVGFSAILQISRSAFGVHKYSGLLADDVEIEIQAEFIRQTPG